MTGNYASHFLVRWLMKRRKNPNEGYFRSAGGFPRCFESRQELLEPTDQHSRPQSGAAATRCTPPASVLSPAPPCLPTAAPPLPAAAQCQLNVAARQSHADAQTNGSGSFACRSTTAQAPGQPTARSGPVDELPPVGERLLCVDTDVGVQANSSVLTIPTHLTGRARICLYTPRPPRIAR